MYLHVVVSTNYYSSPPTLVTIVASFTIGLRTGLVTTNHHQPVWAHPCIHVSFLPPLVQVENDVSEFSLCVFYDNGRKELCKDDDYPLKLRLKLGPSEDIAKLFVIESSEVEEILSAEVKGTFS